MKTRLTEGRSRVDRWLDVSITFAAFHRDCTSYNITQPMSKYDKKCWTPQRCYSLSSTNAERWTVSYSLIRMIVFIFSSFFCAAAVLLVFKEQYCSTGCRFDSSSGLSPWCLHVLVSLVSSHIPETESLHRSLDWRNKVREWCVCVPGDGPATCPPCEQAAAPPVTLIKKNHRIITDCWSILGPERLCACKCKRVEHLDLATTEQK